MATVSDVEMVEKLRDAHQRLRKEILLNGVKRPVSDIIGHFNAVIFVPQMSAVIEGAPDAVVHALLRRSAASAARSARATT